MNHLTRNSQGIGKVTLSFTSLIIILAVSVIAVSYYSSNSIGTLQTTNKSLQNEVNSLQNNLTSLQSQYTQLNNEYQQLLASNTSSQTSQIASLQNQVASLQNQIANLQTQLSNATATIAKLQGQTGILPEYMNLGYEGGNYGGSYYLGLTLKNTGSVPITQIFVMLNSVSIAMNFTYLNTTVSADAPLPAYQTATGRQNVSPPIGSIGTYSLIIQAQATNGAVYNYNTTITAHV